MNDNPSINPARPGAVRLMTNLGLVPDPWQVEVLQAGHQRLLLNCCRQAGKSTAVAMLGLAEAVFLPGTKVLLLSRSLRQSKELFGIVTDFFQRMGAPLKQRQTLYELQLSNFSRIICLPCKEETIRGFSRVSLLVIDEAARVPDDVYRAVRPMLAVSNGRLICLSTPYGKRGFFYDAWVKGGNDWARIEIPAQRISRITRTFLEQERRAMGESWFRQEYCCSFEMLQGLVYPNLPRCVVPGPAPAGGKRVGGIDFGYHNPFAAVWGTVDGTGMLWLTGEHYSRKESLRHHAENLARDVTWYADPSGATEISELRLAGLAIRGGINTLRAGIGAVSARIENGTLRIVQGCCANLLAEAELYRYSDAVGDRSGETPVDEHNHALAALRYLISRVDERYMARARRATSSTPPTPGTPTAEKPGPAKRKKSRFWELAENEDVWTTF
jgi:hypothetical protein